MNKEGKSLEISADLLEKFKALIPSVFSEGKLDFEKLKALVSDEFVGFNDERYHLTWAGKSDCYKVIQEPTTDTLVPCKEESVNWDTTENIFIEGENLEVLKILQKSYYGKIKLIYIDPPYNTGNDSFIYPDRFAETKEEYLKRAGDIDEEGYVTKEGLFRKNSKESGRFHSNWLSMIYPRLFLARNLLRDDGVIFVSIDDNEVHNLRMIMNEIFGEENFIAEFIHKNNSSKNQAKLVSISTEYLISYARNKSKLSKQEWRVEKRGASEIARLFEKLKKEDKTLQFIETEIKTMYKRAKYAHLSRWNKIDDNGVFKDADLSREGGPKDYTIINPITNKPCVVPSRGWGKSHDELLKLQNEGLIWYGDEHTPPGLKDYLSFDDLSVPDNFFYFDNSVDTRWLKSEFGILLFENPKPLEMIKQIIGMVSENNDIVLDFFSGSSTTAHSILELNKKDNINRKFIMVQLPEKTSQDSEAFQAGYKTIPEIGKERIRRVINRIILEIKEQPDLFEANFLDLGFRVFKHKCSNFKQWRIFDEDEIELTKQLDAFTEAQKENAEKENILFELMLKAGIELTKKIDFNEFDSIRYYSIDLLIDDEIKKIIFLLDDINEKLVAHLITEKPVSIICLDSILKNNDELKTNTALQMQDANINFQTV